MSDFVLCIDNRSNPASLIVGKVYRRLPDPEAEAHHMVRILDEDRSEAEGYLYPAALFVPIELPEAARQACWPPRRPHRRRREVSRKCHCYDADPWVKGAGGVKYKPVTAWHWDYPPELKRSLPPHLLSNLKKSVQVCSRCGLPLRCWCLPVGDGDAADTPGDQG